MSNESINLVLNIINTVILFSGLIFVYFQFKNTNKVHRDNHDWNRRIASHNALHQIFVEQILEIKRSVFSIVGETKYYLGDYLICSKNLTNENKQKVENLSIKLLNNYTEFSLQINNNVLDENICYQLTAFSCVRDYHFLLPLIKARRELLDEIHLYLDFETRANNWNEKMKAKSAEYQKKINDTRGYKDKIS